MMIAADEPLDLTDMTDRDAGLITEAWSEQAVVDRRALLVEVKRLRAQLADAWDEGHDAGIDHAHQIYSTNPYRYPENEFG